MDATLPDGTPVSVVPDLDELARRLDVANDPTTEPLLQQAAAVAVSMLDPRCSPTKVGANPATYLEAVYQLAVKVWDTGTRGMVSLDEAGGFDLSTTATAGMYRAVLGVAQPVLTTGGVVIG
jgi:hypothetical protein